MSDPAPVTPPAPAPAPAPAAPPAPATPPAPAPAPQWDGPYDEDRAKSLIANLRAELAEVKAKKPEPPAEVAELKTQLDAITAQMEATRTEAIEAAKRAAIAEAKVPAHLAGYVTGKTAEEIKASAEKVAADFAGSQPAPVTPPSGLPRPAPTSGRAPADSAPAFDPVATARAARGY